MLIWDIRQGLEPVRAVQEVHGSDINTVDWSYQDENLIATGSNDATVKILDIRKLPSE